VARASGGSTRLGALIAVLAALAASGVSRTQAAPSAPPYQLNDYSQGHVFAITPPGENGLVSAMDVLSTGVGGLPKLTAPPAHSVDTLPLYANLLYNYKALTDAQIPQYFVDESFGVAPGKLTRTESPGGRSDVTIYRDNYGIAHVYGQTDAAMEFGAGYVAAEDRLFFMDVLRHVGSGTTTSFLGPSCSDELMDHQQLLLTGGYSHDDKMRQIRDAASIDPVLGPRALAMAQSYADGINQYISETVTDPSKLPADYGAASLDPQHPLLPQPFDITNVVDIGSVIGGQLGRGGGGEAANASLVQYLQTKFGAADAASIFKDFKQQNDPQAPTTSDFAFPYEIPGTIDPSKTVMPDAGVPLSRPDKATTPGCDPVNNPVGFLGNPGAILPSGLPVGTAAASIAQSALAFPKGMSNALLVDAAHSSEGHPLAVFGSQAAYFVPEIWMAQDLHAPDYDASGFSIPGISLIIEIGRGQDFAWSATSASTDNQDVRGEIICDPNGGAPAAMGTSYMYNGKCTPMSHTTFTQYGFPSLASMAGLQTYTQEIYTSVHGVIQGWTTSNGKPIALVLQRSTYEGEPYSVLGFLRWGTPSLTHDAQSWMAGTYEIEFPFNWLYVDDRDIAYAVSGRDPMRPSFVDPNLPTTGDGSAEWQGFLSDAGHPHQIGSAKGYITSWNNKPAPMFSASDSQYEYGTTYRNQSLVDAILAQFAAHGGKISEANLVSAMETAATIDLEGTRILPELLPYLAAIKASAPPTAQVSAMIDQLTSWLAAGAHRVRAAQGDPQYDHAAAVAIMDELYPRLIEAMFDPLFKAGGVSQQDGLDNAYRIVPFEWANNPNFDGQHLGSAYDGGWDGYVQKLLRQLQGESVGAPFGSAVTSRICGGGPPTCAAAIEKAFETAAGSLAQANGSGSVASWTKTTSSVAATKGSLPDYDALHYRSIGLNTVPPQDWQNRPTQQQVAFFPAHRPRAGDAGVTAAAGVTPAIPNTAAPSGVAGAATVAALLGGAALLAVRRRRRPGPP
jgi:acyl-homoserine lactone acylase PvdQ